jgi:hypothetical protein
MFASDGKPIEVEATFVAPYDARRAFAREALFALFLNELSRPTRSRIGVGVFSGRDERLVAFSC